MDLKTADRYSESIREWLKERCERIEIAGSIRRRRPNCNDVDVVCIPRYKENTNLFGQVEERINLVHDMLVDYVKATPGTRWHSGGNVAGNWCSLQLPKCQLDVFFADAENFGTVLLCRTGSKEHNIWISQRAERMGGHWGVNHGLEIAGDGQIVRRTEEEIYDALELPFLEPVQRESYYLRTL